MVQDSSIPVAWEASPIPWTLSEMYPPRSPGGAWAPQHPFAEHGFKVPACLLEIKLLCRSGVWGLAEGGQQEAVASLQPGKLPQCHQQAPVWGKFWCIFVFSRWQLELFAAGGEVEMGAKTGRAPRMQQCPEATVMRAKWVTLHGSLVTTMARAGLRRAVARRALPGGLAMSLRCRQFPALSIDPCKVLREAGASIGAKPWAAARPKASLGRGMRDPALGDGSQGEELDPSWHRCPFGDKACHGWGQATA